MAVQFSSRTAWDTSPSRLSERVRGLRAEGAELIDLTVSNPTVCGFRYDAASTLAPLSDPAALLYDPDPRGVLSAREAVSGYYRNHGASVDAAQIILTTSTSEAYSYLLRLLCDAGDAVLLAQPGYPLLDFLADLDDVALHLYPLFFDFGWWIDFAELRRRITPRTRAVILVHPNNPTGHATGKSERAELEALCMEHHLALVVDEVFLDYGLDATIESFAHGPHPCLTFVVSGISKIAALPQMKVGWLSVFGPATSRAAALARLEVIADTFLSMNAPAQQALPHWLAARKAIQTQILDRLSTNRRTLLAGRFRMLPVAAGWSAILLVPQWKGGSDVAERLAAEIGLLVHPGAFYGLGERNALVISLLVAPAILQMAVEKLNSWCEPEELTNGRSGSFDGFRLEH